MKTIYYICWAVFILSIIELIAILLLCIWEIPIGCYYYKPAYTGFIFFGISLVSIIMIAANKDRPLFK